MFIYKDGSWEWQEKTLIPYSIGQYLKVSEFHGIGGSVTSPGTKVLYMPRYVYPDPMGVGVEVGFIVRVTQPDVASCMFFSRSASHEKGFIPDINNLRTRSNTELTSMSDLYFANYPGTVIKLGHIIKAVMEENNAQ